MSKKVKQLVPELRFSEFEGDWEKTSIEKISTIITSGSRGWAQYYSTKGAKFIRMTNLDRNNIDLLLDDLKYVSLPSNNSEGKRTALTSGDILISITAELGKIGIVPNNLGEAYVNQHVALVRPNSDKVDSLFLAFKLSNYDSNKRLNRLNDSGAKAGLNLGSIKKFPLKIPYIKEQNKIASFLDKIALRINQLRRKHELLETYKKGVMQKIFSQQIRFKQDDGKPFPDWEKKNLGEICSLIKDGTHGTHKDDPNGQFFLLSAKNVFNGRVLYDNNDRKISQTEFLSIYKNYTLEKNDILLSIVGSIGRVAIFDGTNNLAFQRSVAFFRLKKDISSFIYHQMTSFLFQRELLRRQVVSAQPGIYLGDLGKILVFIPCFEEQHKITNFLTSIDKKIEAVALQIKTMEDFKKGLLQKMFI